MTTRTFQIFETFENTHERHKIFHPDLYEYLSIRTQSFRLLGAWTHKGIHSRRSYHFHQGQRIMHIFLLPDKSATECCKKSFKAGSKLLVIVPLRFGKAGRVWCGGARETREPHVTIE